MVDNLSMRMISILFFLALSTAQAKAETAKTVCTCKCVIKEDGKYGTAEASGKDREEAGKKLKKAMGKGTCELTPVCTGKCASD